MRSRMFVAHGGAGALLKFDASDGRHVRSDQSVALWRMRASFVCLQGCASQWLCSEPGQAIQRTPPPKPHPAPPLLRPKYTCRHPQPVHTLSVYRDVPLNGYGSEPGEADWPAYTRFAVAHVGPDRFFYLTYAGGRVHAWDAEGARVGGATLEGAGDLEMSCHSFR